MNQMTRITAAPAEGFSARFTAAEFLRMIEADVFDDDDKIELIEGEFYRMPPPGNNHGHLQARILGRLFRIVAEALVRGEAGIELDKETLVGFDAAVLRTPVIGRRMLRPDELSLVIEIAETSLAQDLGVKRHKYAEAGIPVYWVVDSSRSVIHVHAEPVEGEYVDIHTVRFGQPLAVPGSGETITLD